ncbi:hypothetical protein [Bradyrhizobium sp. 1200_D9_N1_1]|uniref:hypothetical protein n=1 Tax=Bradyrhizobium sp. 1200_D9_N1_1 TaxID=3239013 RepID=UPI003D52DC27
MIKKLDADSAAKQVTEALQPVSDFRVVQPTDPRQAPPVKQPLPGPLEQALGINQPWKKPGNP